MDEANNDDDKAIIRHGKSKKLFQRASPMKLVRLYPSMSSDQVSLIKQSHFGGLLDIKCSKLQPELCKFLMESFNPATCELVFPGRGSIPVTEESVYTVLGVPWGDKDVRYELDRNANTFMIEQFGGGKQPQMSSLEEKLLGMKKADNKYLRFWVVYAMCSVLAPTTATRVSPRCYPSLVNIKEVKNLNFCKFIIRMLCEAAKSSSEKGILKACMLFFMVKYLDSLELKDMEIKSEGTRVTVWTNSMVLKAISQDLSSDGTFGMAPLKAEFANTETEFANAETSFINDETEFANSDGGSENADIPREEEEPTDGQNIIFSNPDKIELFIEMNTPAECKSEGKSKKLFQRASPMKLVRLYRSMSSDQISLIKKSDFGGLVDIKCSKLQPELCKFLMESFNPATCELVFPGRGSIPVTEESVYTVLGVPWGDKDVRYELDTDANTFMMEQFGHGGGKQPLMSSIEEQLLGMKKADNKYLRFWVVYAMCSVLAPTTATRVSPRCYASLVNIKEVKNLNFCKFVIRMLCEAAKSSSEKGILKACMLFFMVKYLDSLELKDMEIKSEGTRVTVWTNSMVLKAISQDLSSDGTFGMAPLKAEFANTENRCANAETRFINDKTEFANAETSSINEETEFTNADGGSENADIPREEEEPTDGQSILFSDPDKIGLFIKMNTPADCKSEDTAIFREAVEEACLGFETGLKNMLKKLALRRPVEKKFRAKRKTGHPVAERRDTKRRKHNREEQLSPIPASSTENPESSDKTSDNDDYIVEDEEQAQTESNVSLEDESVDLGEESCSYRCSSSGQDGHDEPDGGLVPRCRGKEAKPGAAGMHEGCSKTVSTSVDDENRKEQQPCEPIMITSTSPSSEHTAGCGQISVNDYEEYLASRQHEVARGLLEPSRCGS